MQYLSARNPRYTKDGMIDLLVDFAGLGEVAFTASDEDAEPHGRELFAGALAGEFGQVAEAG
jgi:hypothetical protein